MRRFILLVTGIATATSAAVFAADGTLDLKADFYVATDGSDAWSGRLPAANAARTDGPFGTLERARDAVRHVDRMRRTTPLVVMVRGGTYFSAARSCSAPATAARPRRR